MLMTTSEASVYCRFKTTGALRKARLEGRIRSYGRRGGTGTLMWEQSELDRFLRGTDEVGGVSACMEIGKADTSWSVETQGQSGSRNQGRGEGPSNRQDEVRIQSTSERGQADSSEVPTGSSIRYSERSGQSSDSEDPIQRIRRVTVRGARR